MFIEGVPALACLTWTVLDSREDDEVASTCSNSDFGFLHSKNLQAAAINKLTICLKSRMNLFTMYTNGMS